MKSGYQVPLVKSGSSNIAFPLRIASYPVATTSIGQGDYINLIEQRSLPLVLAGPFLRYVSQTEVLVWLATSIETDIAARIFDADSPGVPLAQGKNEYVKLGERLFINIVRIRAEGLPISSILGYNLSFSISPDSGWSLVGDCAVEASWVCLSSFDFPTFCLSGSSDFRIVHGSCRKLHGPGSDAVTQMRRLLEENSNKVTKRPSYLYLTGDQIYADDVDESVLSIVRTLGLRLLGRSERLPVLEEDILNIDAGERGALVRGEDDRFWVNGEKRRSLFTVGGDHGQNHLIGLGEYCAMYLLAWSPFLCEEYLKPLISLGASPDNESFSLVLANTPTLMMFDDHEVTDDWNLNYDWNDSVSRHSGTARIVANALTAYWAFQDIGNSPTGIARRGFKASSEGRSLSFSGHVSDDFIISSERGWSFVGPDPIAPIFLDIRTQRKLEILKNPGLLDEHALSWLKATLSTRSPNKPVVIVSPTPVTGIHVIELLQQEVTNRERAFDLLKYAWTTHFSDDPRGHQPAMLDPESWVMNAEYYRRFISVLAESPAKQIIFLSGDVHYGFSTIGTIRLADKQVKFAQLTSSSLKNKAPGLKGAVLKSLNHVLLEGSDLLEQVDSLVNGIGYRYVRDRKENDFICQENNFGVVDLVLSEDVVEHRICGESNTLVYRCKLV